MPKNKQLEFLDEAERLFVVDGIETKAISAIFKNQISRRQLDEWKKLYNWEKKRENYRSKRNNLQDIILESVNAAANTFLLDPSAKNNKELRECIKTAKMMGIDLGIKVKGEEVKKAAPADIAAKIKKILKVK